MRLVGLCGLFSKKGRQLRRWRPYCILWRAENKEADRQCVLMYHCSEFTNLITRSHLQIPFPYRLQLFDVL